MFTENGVMVDMDEVRRVVDACDVFTIGFRLFPQRLIVDARTAEGEGPLVEVVQPVGTVEERFFWLGKRRPDFGVPQQFTFFVWPHSLRFFVECGLADRIRERVKAAERRSVGRRLKAALGQLVELERQAGQDAISGRGFQTLWSRT